MIAGSRTLRLAASWALLAVLLGLAGCGPSLKSRVAPELVLEPGAFRTEVNHWPDTCGSSGFAVLDVYDPWEPLNRNIYSFNAGFDTYVFLPATQVYETVLPSPARTGVKNVVNNLNEVGNFVNATLQGKLEKSAVATSRFLINSTFGVAGLWDVASNNPHLKPRPEDFGQTLGVWGFGNGPYFVMPFLGPSNLRDTVGFGGDFMLLWWEMKVIYKNLGVNDNWNWTVGELVIRSLNLRSNTPFRYHETGSPFEYELVRFVYTKKRELDIRK